MGAGIALIRSGLFPEHNWLLFEFGRAGCAGSQIHVETRPCACNDSAPNLLLHATLQWEAFPMRNRLRPNLLSQSSLTLPIDLTASGPTATFVFQTGFA